MERTIHLPHVFIDPLSSVRLRAVDGTAASVNLPLVGWRGKQYKNGIRSAHDDANAAHAIDEMSPNFHDDSRWYRGMCHGSTYSVRTLVTGGAGFIGSRFVEYMLRHHSDTNPFCSRRNSRWETTRLVRKPARTSQALLRHQQTGLV